MLEGIARNNFYGLLWEENKNEIREEELKKIINSLEEDIANGDWISKDYARLDLQLMPYLVSNINKKHPEISLSFAGSRDDLEERIKFVVSSGSKSARILTKIGSDGIHFTVLDYRVINDKKSLVLFEPANLGDTFPALNAIRIKCIINNMKVYDFLFSMVSMNIQKSVSECGIFSLFLSKKLYLESDNLKKLHKDNIDGVLCERDRFLKHEELDKYLPVTFYKHVQSAERIYNYLLLHEKEERENYIINKKNQTILERCNDYLHIRPDGKNMSTSAHIKRKNLYEKLLIKSNSSS